MENPLLDNIKSAVKNWWLSLIIGILFLGMSLWMLFFPISSYIAISWVFSICVFAVGIFEIGFAASNSKTLQGWGWYLTMGIVDLLIGVFLVVSPIEVSEIALWFVVAFWLMFRGFGAVGFSMDLNTMGVRGWGWYLVGGILAIICSILVLWNPMAGMLATSYLVAFAFLFAGIFRIALSIELKSLKNGKKPLEK